MSHRDLFMKTLEARAIHGGLTDREVREATGPLTTTEALTAALTHRGGVLLLLGPPGTGKTLAATRWILAPLLELRNWWYENERWSTPRRYTFAWRTAKSLSRVKQYETRDVEFLFDVQRLVLDDLGQEYLDKQGFLASAMDELVTERHRRGRATVMTANQNVEEFQERYGDRVFDRTAGEGRVVLCGGDSLRGAPVKPTMPHACSAREVAARVKECEDKATADALQRHVDWVESERQRAAAAAANPPAAPVKPMTKAEEDARKAEIARQLEDYGRRNSG